MSVTRRFSILVARSPPTSLHQSQVFEAESAANFGEMLHRCGIHTAEVHAAHHLLAPPVVTLPGLIRIIRDPRRVAVHDDLALDQVARPTPEQNHAPRRLERRLAHYRRPVLPA
jgi:hypothetical protein